MQRNSLASVALSVTELSVKFSAAPLFDSLFGKTAGTLFDQASDRRFFNNITDG
jgi:hypothetical protein